MTPFKTILLSLLVSLTACVCFHWPFAIWIFMYLAIGCLIGLAGYKVNKYYYGHSFIYICVFGWPVMWIVLLAESDLLEAMSNIIPGYKINLEIEKDENEE